MEACTSPEFFATSTQHNYVTYSVFVEQQEFRELARKRKDAGDDKEKWARADAEMGAWIQMNGADESLLGHPMAEQKSGE